jgi:photosystem II stability/assembly factor-like uncharacterized protein
MQARTVLPYTLLVIAACSASSNSSQPADSGPAEGAVAEGGANDDAPADGNTPYEQSVLAARWQPLSSAPTVSGGAKQDDIFFLDPMNGWLASGPNFALYQTTDGGMTWTQSVQMKGTYFRAVLFTDAQHGFAGNLGAGLSAAISDANVMYATSNGGSSWTPVTTSITGAAASGICNFSAVDATHLVAVGRANGPANLLTSSNGGSTWTSVDLSKSFLMVIDARFTTATDGLIVGMSPDGYANVVHTPDAGVTLTSVFKSKVANTLSWKISFPSNDVGYVAIQDASEGPPTIAKTTNGGAAWTELPLPVMTSSG